MKAIVQVQYGSPDVLRLKDIDKPVVKDDEVLVRVHAAAVNIGTGTPEGRTVCHALGVWPAQAQARDTGARRSRAG
jgi:hypothetical protein